MTQLNDNRFITFTTYCEEPTRVDKIISDYIKSNTSFSRSIVSSWISKSLIKVNGIILEKSSLKMNGDIVVEIDLSSWEPKKLRAEADPEVELDIIFEDNSVLIIDKSAGMVVHPGAGISEKTLVNGLISYLGDGFSSKMNDYQRPGIVHRLDKNTSGIMLIAKTLSAHQNVASQFHPDNKIAKRSYLALVRNLPDQKKEEGSICLPIGRDKNNRLKMSVVEEGRYAKTNWRVDEYLNGAYLLSLSLETGRTHQIRVHLHHEGASILGDPLYGEPLLGLPTSIRDAVKPLTRQMLHAYKLSFLHPESKKEFSFECPIPEDMKEAILRLK